MVRSSSRWPGAAGAAGAASMALIAAAVGAAGLLTPTREVGCQEPGGECRGFRGRICFSEAQCGVECQCEGLVFPPLEEFEQDPPGGSNITPGRCEPLGPPQGPEPPPDLGDPHIAGGARSGSR